MSTIITDDAIHNHEQKIDAYIADVGWVSDRDGNHVPVTWVTIRDRSQYTPNGKLLGANLSINDFLTGDGMPEKDVWRLMIHETGASVGTVINSMQSLMRWWERNRNEEDFGPWIEQGTKHLLIVAYRECEAAEAAAAHGYRADPDAKYGGPTSMDGFYGSVWRELAHRQRRAA